MLLPPRIEMVDLVDRHQRVGSTAEQRLIEVLRSGRWMDGHWVDRAEQWASQVQGFSHAVGLGSGTDALCFSMMAMGIGPGDEVIVPAFSFVSTATSVLSVGAKPCLVDVDDAGLLAPHRVEEAMSDRTKAAIRVHLFGSHAPHVSGDLPLVDDAAQAVGLRTDGRRPVFSVLSAYPTKTWGAAGDAGFALTDDATLAQHARALGNHGRRDDGYHHVSQHVGRTSRLNALQAALLMAHAEDVEARIARRRAIAMQYDAGLPPKVKPLPRSRTSTVHQYCVTFDDEDSRQRARAQLTRCHVGSAVYYDRTLAEHPVLSQSRVLDIDNARRLSRTILALPCHAGISNQDVGRVLEALHDV